MSDALTPGPSPTGRRVIDDVPLEKVQLEMIRRHLGNRIVFALDALDIEIEVEDALGLINPRRLRNVYLRSQYELVKNGGDVENFYRAMGEVFSVEDETVRHIVHGRKGYE